MRIVYKDSIEAKIRQEIENARELGQEIDEIVLQQREFDQFIKEAEHILFKPVVPIILDEFPRTVKYSDIIVREEK